MSLPKKINVNCSNCKKKFEVTVFDSLNTDYSHDVVTTVINGERFKGKCPHCGYSSQLEYNMLYHDTKHRAMIWVIHPNNTDYEKKIEEVRSILFLPYSITRIVSNMKELREKAACLESEKDDRVIELCKTYLAYTVQQQKPDYNITDIFYTYCDGKDFVFFYDETGNELCCVLDNKIYTLIVDLYKKQLEQMENEPYQIIDNNWANDFFNSISIDDIEALKNNQTSDSEADETDSASLSCKPEKQSVKMKALYCRKCGEKLLPDSIFCSYCGTKVIYL